MFKYLAKRTVDTMTTEERTAYKVGILKSDIYASWFSGKITYEEYTLLLDLIGRLEA